MSHQKIAIALPIEDSLLKPLHHWGGRFDWSNIREVHLIHIVKKSVTPLEFGLVEMPDEKTYNEMVPTLQKYLRDEAKKIIPSTFRGEVLFHLSCEFNPTEEMTKMLKNFNASLVVVSTQGKHGIKGFFHSSFTEQMVKFAPCDVYVVRPEASV